VNKDQSNDNFSIEIQSQSPVVVAAHHSIAEVVLSATPPDVLLLNLTQAQPITQETMYLRVLRAKTREWGPDHWTTLDTVMELGSLYVDEGNRPEAERMFSRALRGYRKVNSGDNYNQKTQEILRRLEHVRESGENSLTT
jgi:hypothetical protein